MSVLAHIYDALRSVWRCVPFHTGTRSKRHAATTSWSLQVPWSVTLHLTIHGVMTARADFHNGSRAG